MSREAIVDDLVPIWIRDERPNEQETSGNPYVDLLVGNKPPEIIAFEINMNPYANMPPNMSGTYRAPVSHAGSQRGHGKLISLVLLVPALLVVGHEFVARIGH